MIYITTDSCFETRFRDIFQGTRLRHTAAAESKKWLSSSNMQYRSQILNFAVFCATLGCGICWGIFDNGLGLPHLIRAFFKFHVYFTIRRILYQMGRIQLCPVISSLMNLIKSLRFCLMEKDLQWVWNKFIERFPFYSREKSWSGKRLHLCDGSYSYEFIKPSDDEEEGIKETWFFS